MKFDLFSELNKKIPQHLKLCFISSMIVGILTHFYMLTHKLCNWDDINNLSRPGSGDYLGRWFLKYIHPLGSIYSIPAVHGMLFILCLSLSACFIVEIMQIKSRTGVILVPALMMTFPSVVSTMTFMFMAHTSGIGILMVCVAVYLFRKYKWGFVPATAMLVCVLGTYQSYISFAITLMLMGMICDLINGKKFPEMLKHGILCVLVLGVSVVIYMVLSHLIYPNIDQETYGGVGNMGKIALSEMPKLIGRCYKRFLEFFLWKPFAFVTKSAKITNIITCVLAVVLFGIISIKRKLYEDKLAYALLIIVCGFMPLAAAFIYFMAPEVDYSMLMLYSYVLIYVTVLALLEYCMQDWEGMEKPSGLHKIMASGITIVTIVTIFVSCYCDYLLTNRAYLRTDIASGRVKSYFNRILSVAETTKDFNPNEGLVILGEFYYRNNPSSVEIDLFNSEDLRELSGVALENGLITSGVRDNFIETFVGYELADLTDKEKQAIMDTQDYKNMPIYPHEGCVEKINGIWVVKLCD